MTKEEKLAPKTIRIALILFLLVLVSGNFNAYAELIKLKGIEISGGVTESITYNSNPGYSSVSEQGHDFANLMNFDFNLGVPFGSLHSYNFNSTADWYQYFDNKKYNQFNFGLVQSVDLIFNRAALNLHQSLVHTSIPTTRENVVISNGILKKDVNAFGYAFKADLGKLKAETGCDFEIYRAYEQYKVMDSNNITPYVEGGFEITPVLDGFTRYTYMRTQNISSVENNSNQHKIVGGLRGELSKYLVGEVNAGYSAMIFNDKNASLDNQNYYGLTFNSSLTNRLSNHTTQMLALAYEPQTSYNVGNFYKTLLLTYTATHKLNRFINLSGLFEYENAMESSGLYMNEKINYLRAGGGFDYIIAKNLSLRADYKYGDKNSNRNGKGWKQHIVTAGLNYRF